MFHLPIDVFGTGKHFTSKETILWNSQSSSLKLSYPTQTHAWRIDPLASAYMRVSLVIVFYFCSQKLVFVLFSNFESKMWFSTVFNPFFLFGDCFQWRVFIYNCHTFHSLHKYSHHWESLNPWELRRASIESHPRQPWAAPNQTTWNQSTSATVWPPSREPLCTPVTMWSHQLHYTENNSTTASDHHWPDLDWFLHLYRLV